MQDVQETEVAIMLRMHDRKSDGFAYGFAQKLPIRPPDQETSASRV